MQTKQLDTLLDDIWRLGDKDEMSIKHIGHGLAALIAHGNWQLGDDYSLPDWENTEQLKARITPLWEQVSQLKDQLGPEFLDLVRVSKFSYYPLKYLEAEWLSYKDALEATHEN